MVSGINGATYNPYELYSNSDKTYFNPVQYQYQQPILTGGVSTTGNDYAARRDNTADGKDDGSIGFWGATKNMAKGVWNFLTSPFKNDKGEWSLGSTLKSLAIAGLFIAGNALTGGALTPILLAAGAIMGVGGAVKAGYNIATAKTDAEAEAAWQSMGSSAATLAATAVGAKGYAKAQASSAAEAEALASGATAEEAAQAGAQGRASGDPRQVRRRAQDRDPGGRGRDRRGGSHRRGAVCFHAFPQRLYQAHPCRRVQRAEARRTRRARHVHP